MEEQEVLPPLHHVPVTFSHAVYCHISDFICALHCTAASVAQHPVAEVERTPEPGVQLLFAPPPHPPASSSC